MKLIRFFILFVALFGTFALSASFIELRNDKIIFSGYFGTEPLVSGKNYFSQENKDSVTLETCRFYISDVRLYQGNIPVAQYPVKLIDLFDTARTSFSIPFYSAGDVTEIRFNLGIDSATNVGGVGKGDLDPMHGMYWTWQSGYINFKLEGKSALCRENRNRFQYHIGGYAAPHYAMREVILKVNEDHGDFEINVDVSEFFNAINLSHLTHVMSPSAESQKLANTTVKMFSVAP